MFVRVLVTLAVSVGTTGIAAAASAGKAPSVTLDRSRYMGVAQIKPGMTGVGRTVLKGAELVEFQVTVVDVLWNWGPKQHAILIRCAGANLEHSGIIMGMSGSPVYLQDPEDGGKLKMIGAVAFGWRWNKDPVGGVTPIEQMLAAEGFADKGKTAAPEGGGGVAGGGWSDPVGTGPPAEPNRGLRSRYAMMGFTAPILVKTARPIRRGDRYEGLEPLMTPLLVSGASRSAMAYLQGRLEGSGLYPIQAGGAGGGNAPAPDKLVPGGSLVVPFLIGDVDMAAVGTVTEVVGDRVLGFGHSMMGEGPIEMPMATGRVHTPISSLAFSFKLASMGKLVGALLWDDEAGIWGVTGRKARMVPVDVSVTEPKGRRTYHYQALHHHRMTPWVIGSALMMSVMANRDLPREHTLRYTVSVDYEKLGRFAVDNVSSMGWLFGIRSDLTEPMSMLMDNQFGRARVKRVEMAISIEPKASTASMERVELPRSTFKPGETVEVAVRWRPYRAEPFVRRYAMTLPKDLPDGSYQLQVGSGRSRLTALRKDKPHLFRAESLDDMMSAVRLIGSVRTDQVYLRLGVQRGGVAVGKTEMPELPSFRRKVFDEAKLHAVQAYAEPIVVEHPVPFVVSGEKVFTIKVDRRADQ